MSTTISKNAEFAKTLDMPAEFQAKAAAFADAKGLSLAAREVVAEFKDAWTGSDGKTRPANVVLIVTADAAMALALKAGRNFAPVSTEWTVDGKEWVDVWISANPPAACRVTFEVEGITAPVVVVHTLAEYTQGKLTGVQRTMPATMLAKATIQMGLRRIAPQALAGLYVAEEIEAVDAARDAEIEHAAEVREAVTPPSDKEAKGATMTRAEQYAARRAALVESGKALRADLGDAAAIELATHIKESGADPDKLTAAQIKSILAASQKIRDAHAAGAATGTAPDPVPAEPEPAPADPAPAAPAAPAPAAATPVAETPAEDPGLKALADAFDGEFVI